MKQKPESDAPAVSQAFLPFSRPSISELEVSSVADVLRSGWITTGNRCAGLEQRFRELTGCKHAIALSSATAGMHLLMHAMGIGPGDEVITPSMTWVSAVNQIVIRGAKPVFVDVERNTLMTTAELIEPLLTARTRLILPVHFAGAALNIDPLRKLSTSHDIPLVEDAAHAIGTCYKGKHIGHQGTAIFSFHPIKNITTGEGGMLCTDSADLAERIRRLRFHGLGVDAFDRETQGRAPRAEVLEPGFKYNLPDMNAVLGISQLARLDELNKKRTWLAKEYLNRFQTVDEIVPLGLPGYPFTHAWHLFVVRLDLERSGMSRDEFMQRLKDRGIGTGLHFRAVHTHRYYREQMVISKGSLRNTEWNSERICSLPLFPDMQQKDVERVVDAVKSVLAGRVNFQ